MAKSLPPLIQALCNPALHGYPKAGVRVVETHISWVLLTGEYAYKIKKPVDLGFLDFSTLALRRQFCLEELRLNQRLAADLYLGVVAITGEAENPVFDGGGPVLEYAVKLRQFDEACLLDRLIDTGGLDAKPIDGLARELAAFHAQAACATAEDGHGRPEAILAAAEQGFGHLRQAIPAQQARLQALQAWTETEFARLREVFLARKQAGHVRECHGDLHCGNLVLLGGRLVAFDCIEFSEDLRWIDCFSELAFIVMDLDAHGRPDFASRLLNRYLHATGDYAGLAVFNFYRVYRALVRAKIAGISLGQATDAGVLQNLENRCLRYLDEAERAQRPTTPLLLMTHGLSGSGKSTLAAVLAERLPAIRIVSDIERKRLAGLAELDRSQRLAGGIYTQAYSQRTYARLLDCAEHGLRAGFNVLLDAAYLRAADRHACRELAERLGLRWVILHSHAPEAVLRERIVRRWAQGGDASEAGPAVLVMQMAMCEPLDAGEQACAVDVDTADGLDLGGVIRALRRGG